MKPIVRFAPSPTGYLHIGGARTALFNWLYAKHHQGTFLLRIEDTDRERSTPDAVRAIIESLDWLGLHHDGEIIYQSKRFARHAEIAHQLVKEQKAYYCYCSPEEVEVMREEARQKGLAPRYNGFWRDRDVALAPKDVRPVIRFKAPTEGETVINDHVQGRVVMQNQQADDLILLRADGTPTYMLSVIVDDHDMNITHIIRGDDHLTNAFRQKQIYEALGWTVPEFAHIPLIHGPDGAKLSKRHGALGVEHYRDMGYLKEALLNYLLRLGWAHGDEEIIALEDAIQWFDLPAIGRSPSRMDFLKLNHVNGVYIRQTDDVVLLDCLLPFLKNLLNRNLDDTEMDHLLKGMKGLKERAKTLKELSENALIYTHQLPDYDEQSRAFLTKENADLSNQVSQILQDLQNFEEESLEQTLRYFAKDAGLKFGQIAQVIRVALTHKTISPSIFEIMHIVGKEETTNRLHRFSKAC